MTAITCLHQLRQLRLISMAEALEHHLAQPSLYQNLSFAEHLELLLDHELQCRAQRRQQRLIRQAKFRMQASPNDLDCHDGRNLKRRQIADLCQCNWIERAQNLLITGPRQRQKPCRLRFGTGCLLDLTVRCDKLSLLPAAFDQARALGACPKSLSKISAIALLIVDDWELQSLSAVHRRDLMELMDCRYGRSATTVVSQLPVEQWHELVGDATLADAILDRLVHNAHRIELKGEPMRKRQALDINAPAGAGKPAR